MKRDMRTRPLGEAVERKKEKKKKNVYLWAAHSRKYFTMMKVVHLRRRSGDIKKDLRWMWMGTPR
jgi:hypothetical protein